MKVYIGIGSNTGDRFYHLKSALQALEAINGIHVIEHSPIYETPPLYKLDQGKFLNAVAQLDTKMSPQELLCQLKVVEKNAGRLPSNDRNTPRPLDLDILAYGNYILEGEELRIPHARLSERKFVLQPWCDIAPEFPVPGTGMTVTELLTDCRDRSEIHCIHNEDNLLTA